MGDDLSIALITTREDVGSPCVAAASSSSVSSTTVTIDADAVLLPIAFASQELGDAGVASGWEGGMGTLDALADFGGDGRMNGSPSNVNYDEVEAEHRNRRRAAAVLRQVRRDRSRSRNRDAVPRLWCTSLLLAPSFGAACRDAVVGRSRRSGAALVDLTDGLTTMEEALNTCRRRVRSETHSFYIGITENPTRRFEEHCLTGSWIEMVVLAKARSSRETSYLERSLISEFGHVHRCSNVGPGGERPSGASPHFVYMVVGINSLSLRSR